jgi:hypothetical protein
MEKKNKVVEVKMKTEAQQIWEEIKDRNIEMFSLPNQKVNNYCKPVEVEPTKLYLYIKAEAVLPSLEVSAGSSFVVEKMERFVVVSRAKPSLTAK